MAYQRLSGQIPGFTLDGMGQGMRDFGDALAQARAEERAREQQQAQMLLDRERMGMQRQQHADLQARQKREDYEQALLKARELAAAGDLDGARSLLAPFGSQFQSVEKEKPLPLQLPGSSQAQPPAPMASPAMPPPIDMGMAQPIDSEDPSRSLGAPVPPMSLDSAAPQVPTPQAPGNPLLDARKQEVHADNVRARTLLSFLDPNGQRVTLDPMAAELQARERSAGIRQRNLADFDAMLKASSDPILAKYAGELRPAIGMSDKPLDMNAVLDHLRTRAKDDQYAAALAQEKNAAREFDWRKTQFNAEEAMKRARLRAARSGSGLKPSQKIDDDRQLATAASSMLTAELTREDYKAQMASVRNGEQILQALESNNAAAHKKAMGQIAKEGAGPGAVTDSERDEFVRTVGGQDQRIAAMALRWLSDGEAPEGQRKIFADAFRNIYQRKLIDQLGQVREGVRDTFSTHPNPAFHGYADWAANRVAGSVLGRKPTGKTEGAKGTGAPQPKPDDKSVDALLDKILNARKAGAGGR